VSKKRKLARVWWIVSADYLNHRAISLPEKDPKPAQTLAVHF
jgi:hypothetical protein